MLPGEMTLPLRRNATARTRLQLFTTTPGGIETPMDLTGHRLRLEIRLYQGAPGGPLLSVDSSGGRIIIMDAATGDVEIDWPSVLADIEELPTTAEAGDPLRPRVDHFAYDLLVTPPGGPAQAILEGVVPVSFGVTRNG